MGIIMETNEKPLVKTGDENPVNRISSKLNLEYKSGTVTLSQSEKGSVLLEVSENGKFFGHICGSDIIGYIKEKHERWAKEEKEEERLEREEKEDEEEAREEESNPYMIGISEEDN